MDVFVVAPFESHLTSIGLFRDAFALLRGQVRNTFRMREGVEMQSRLRVVTGNGEPAQLFDGTRLPVDDSLRTGPCSLVHVASSAMTENEVGERLRSQQGITQWLRERFDQGAVVSATGASVFFLAEAGLLAGAVFAPPRSLVAAFHARYPQIRLGYPRGIFEDGRVCAARSLADEPNLVARLLERVMSPVAAGAFTQAAGLDRVADAELADDPLVAEAQVWLGARFAGSVSLAELASSLSVTHQTLIRRFESALGMLPRDYIRRLRAESAKRQLAQTTRSVSQIANLVGYDDVASFRSMFRHFERMTPTQYRRCNRRSGHEQTEREAG